MTRLRTLPLLALLFSTAALADDETDFATPPPAAWQRVNPLNRATFDFSGGAAHLTCTAPSYPEAQIFGPARASLLAPGVYAQCAVSADLTAWAPTTDRNLDGTFNGVLTRVQTPAGLGLSSGYGLSIIDMTGATGRLQLHRLDHESPVILAAPANFSLLPGHAYRLVLTSAGGVHTGCVFDLADLSTPLTTVTGYDDTYPTGRTGLVISTDRLIALDTTFDNFLAWDGTPPRLTLAPGEFEGTVQLSWDARRGLASRLEESPTLSDWSTAFPFATTQVGPTMQSLLQPAEPSMFYRRHLLGD